MSALVWSLVLALYTSLSTAEANTKRTWYIRQSYRPSGRVISKPAITAYRSYRVRWYQSPIVNNDNTRVNVDPFNPSRTVRVGHSGSYNTERAKRLQINQSGGKNTERAKRLGKNQSGVNNTERAKRLRMKPSGGKEQGLVVNKQQNIKPVVKSKPNIASKVKKKKYPYPTRRFQQKAEKNRTKVSKRTHVKKKVSTQTLQLTRTGNGKKTTKYAGNKMRKPSKTKSQSTLSPAEKVEVVNHHNKARRNVYPPSSNMRKVEWDDVLADVAQRYASRCLGVHNDARHTQQSKFSTLGENIYHTWNWEYYNGQKNILPMNLTRAMDLWEAEKRFFNYFSPSNCPVSTCGHYTQMVRDVSYAVGCGKHFCHSVVFDGKLLHDVHVLVCNYGEGYNNKAVPYEKGRPCSQCGDGIFKCVNGLCVQ